MRLLLPSILIPLFAAPLVTVLRDWKRCSMAVAAVILASLILISLQPMLQSGETEDYPIIPELSLFEFRGDGYNRIFALSISIVALAVSLYSGFYMSSESSPELYYTLYLVCVSSLLGTVFSDSFTTFFVFYELILVTSWVMIDYWGEGRRETAALEYFLFSEVGALLTLLGIVWIYAQFGTLSFDKLGMTVSSVKRGELAAPTILLAIGPLVKMAVVPLHRWLPDAYVEAAVPISALLAGAISGTGAWAIGRFFHFALPGVLNGNGALIILVLALVTQVYGAITALAQDNLKRLLAYSSISQAGYLLLGASYSNPACISGIALLYLTQGIAKACLFMIAGNLKLKTGSWNISRMGGLAHTLPLAASASFLAFLSLSGIPPVIGFWAELTVYLGVFTSVAYSTTLLLAVALLVATSLTAAYSIWTFKRIFFGPPSLKELREKTDLLTLIPLCLAILLLVFGVYPASLFNMLGG